MDLRLCFLCARSAPNGELRSMAHIETSDSGVRKALPTGLVNQSALVRETRAAAELCCSGALRQVSSPLSFCFSLRGGAWTCFLRCGGSRGTAHAWPREVSQSGGSQEESSGSSLLLRRTDSQGKWCLSSCCLRQLLGASFFFLSESSVLSVFYTLNKARSAGVL